MNEHGAEAVRKELIERGNPNRDLTKFLEAQIWPLIPAKVLGREIQNKARQKNSWVDSGSGSFPSE